MGHCINIKTYDNNVNKKKVFAELNQQAIYEGDYHDGLSDDISWLDKEFDSYDQAEQYIHDNYCNWYECVAVKYRDLNGVKKTKKIIELENRISKVRNEYDKLDNNIHYKNVQAQYVTCRTCGSKINKDHLRSNRCPVCGKDMRPESLLERLNAMNKKIKKLEKEVYNEKLKLKGKAKLRWMVKVEYHV